MAYERLSHGVWMLHAGLEVGPGYPSASHRGMQGVIASGANFGDASFTRTVAFGRAKECLSVAGFAPSCRRIRGPKSDVPLLCVEVVGRLADLADVMGGLGCAPGARRAAFGKHADK